MDVSKLSILQSCFYFTVYQNQITCEIEKFEQLKKFKQST